MTRVGKAKQYLKAGRIICQLDGHLVNGSDRRDKAQAQTDSGLGTATLQALKPFQDVVMFFRRNAGAPVRNGKGRAGAVVVNGHCDLAIIPAMFDGVIDNI